MSNTKVIVTLYVSSVQAVRKTADDCRRMIALMDALGVVYDVAHVDTLEMRAFVRSLTGREQLPLCCVGEACVGSYDELMDAMEDGVLPQKLRDVGYSESIRGGDAIPVKPQPVIVKKTVVKKVIVKRPKNGAQDSQEAVDSEEAQSSPSVYHEGEEETRADAGAPSGEHDVPPPPLDDDVPPPPPDDDVPPPPPDDDMPPPPPEDDVPPPPPPPDDDVPPPPPEDDVPPPPPDDDVPPPPPPPE